MLNGHTADGADIDGETIETTAFVSVAWQRRCAGRLPAAPAGGGLASKNAVKPIQSAPDVGVQLLPACTLGSEVLNWVSSRPRADDGDAFHGDYLSRG